MSDADAGTAVGSSTQRGLSAPPLGAGSAAVAPIATLPAYFPVSTCVPSPGTGVIVTVVTGACVSTKNARVAGVGSVMPALIARTAMVCEPSASAGVVNGVVQAANVALSTEHSKLAPELGVAVN